MKVKPRYTESPLKTTLEKVMKSKHRKIEENGKGLVLVNFPKWPKYKNVLLIAHFEGNFTLVKNIWITHNL